MKIFYINLDVGSGIEYVGNIFLNWLKNIDGIELTMHTSQDCSVEFIDFIKKAEPDLIISNESYPRTRVGINEYLKLNPSTKLLFLSHSWQEIMVRDRLSGEFNEFISRCNRIFCLNVMPQYAKDKLKFVDNFCHPISHEIFNITTSWKDRPYKFLYFGNIIPIKLSRSFISEISKTNIQLDCYGNRWKKHIRDIDMQEYNKAFDECPNIRYKGKISRDGVSSLLNQYKYFVLPHDGAEPFNISLLEAIFCGTIPLIVNDTNSKTFDPGWLDWADGFYYSCNSAEDLIKNMILIEKDDPNLEDESVDISTRASKKFDYNRLKDAFKDYINSCRSVKLPSNDIKCVMGREQFIKSRVGPCGAIRNDSIYPIGTRADFDDFRSRAISVAKNFTAGFSYDGESDTYSVEQYAALEGENLEFRGQGESLFLLTLKNDKWQFYKDGRLQFEVTNPSELEKKFISGEQNVYIS